MAKLRKTQTHPWVMAAMLCQATLEEKDNVLSVIRIVDRFTIQVPPEWDRKTPIPLMCQVLLGFKSGDVKGERVITMFGVSPKGKRKKINEQPVVFAGGDHGVNLRINMTLGVRNSGTHWLEVYVGNWLATRMPLTVALEPLTSTSEPSADGKSSG